MELDLSPFMESCTFIIQEVSGLNTEIGSVYSKSSPVSVMEIAVIFGIVGDIKGQVTFTMNTELGHKITSAMLEQNGLEETDEFVRSAISEFGNMVMGHTAGAFYKKGIFFDITPPSILTGDNLLFSFERMNIESIPVKFDDGSMMEINIAYKFSNTNFK